MLNQQLPPEIILLKKKFAEFKKNFNQSWSWIVLGLLCLLALPSTLFIVQPEELAVVQLLGKYNRTLTPGPHFKWPFLEKVTKVTQEILKQEFGFGNVPLRDRRVFDRRSMEEFDEESIMLTGDLNIADVEWVVQYRISDPRQYLFNSRDAENILRDLSEAVMRQAIGDREVTEALTVSREEIQAEVKELLQQGVQNQENGLNVGIQIIAVKLNNVNPPAAVLPSFHAVNAAKQEAERMVNEAKQAYNKVMPEASGQASKTIAVAEGYALNRINRAKGEASRFIELQNAYSKVPQVTKARYYLETMETVLNKVQNIFVVDPKLDSLVPLLQLNTRKSEEKSSNPNSEAPDAN